MGMWELIDMISTLANSRYPIKAHVKAHSAYVHGTVELVLLVYGYCRVKTAK